MSEVTPGAGSCCGGAAPAAAQPAVTATSATDAATVETAAAQGSGSKESSGTHQTHGYIEHKEDLLKRLRRAEGQVRGVHRMVDEDAYCIDILTQVSAATKALERVALALLDDHLRHCVASAAADGGAEAAEKLHEASQAIARLMR